MGSGGLRDWGWGMGDYGIGITGQDYRVGGFSDIQLNMTGQLLSDFPLISPHYLPLPFSFEL